MKLGQQDYSIHTSLMRTYRLTYEDVDEMLDLGYRRNQKSSDRRLGATSPTVALPRNQYPIAGGDD